MGAKRTGALLVLLLLTIADSAAADEITLSGTSIAIRGITIDRIESGTVVYHSQRGRRQMRSVEEVAGLSWDDYPELDEAERMLADDGDRGLIALLRAAIDANTDTQRLWARSRLAKVHGRRGEFVQAAGHAAWVFARDDHPAWAQLAPVGAVNTAATLAATSEAMDNIRRAQQRVKNADLSIALDRLERSIAPVHREGLAGSDSGAEQPAETLSGIAIETLRKVGAVQPKPGSSPALTPSWDRPARPVREATADALALDDSAETAAVVETLLVQGEFEQAAAMCEQAIHERRSSARILHQLGRACLETDRVNDALAAFTRCAILHEDTAYGTQALIDAAMVYRERKNDEATAERLLALAADRAEKHRHTTVPPQDPEP